MNSSILCNTRKPFIVSNKNTIRVLFSTSAMLAVGYNANNGNNDDSSKWSGWSIIHQGKGLVIYQYSKTTIFDYNGLMNKFSVLEIKELELLLIKVSDLKKKVKYSTGIEKEQQNKKLLIALSEIKFIYKIKNIYLHK